MTLRAGGPRVATPTPTPELGAAANGGGGGGPRSDELTAGGAATAGATAACPRCGAPNPAESRFCHACGFGVANAPAVGTPAPPEAYVPIASPAAVLAPFVPTPSPAPQTFAPPPIAPAQPQGAVPTSGAVPAGGLLSPIVRPGAMNATSVTVVCTRCRGIAEPGADFCKFCGQRLNVAASPELASSKPLGVESSGPVRAVASQPIATPAPSSARSANPLASQAALGGYAPSASAATGEHQLPSSNGPAHGATRPLHGIGEATVHGRLVRIAKDGSEGAHYPIVADPSDIGRTEGNIVLPDDPYLSSRHARIVIRGRNGAGSRMALLDLASVNGVFVRLRAPHPLTTGDLLLFGQQVLRFEAVSEIEGARGPAMQHGVLLFGSPAPIARARLVQRSVEGLSRDVMYLVRDELVLGREAGDHTYPDDAFMSRRHAVIRREGSAYVLHDLGSSNGTFVQIHGEHTLQDGDQFRVGHHLFRVDVAAATGAA